MLHDKGNQVIKKKSTSVRVQSNLSIYSSKSKKVLKGILASNVTDQKEQRTQVLQNTVLFTIINSVLLFMNSESVHRRISPGSWADQLGSEGTDGQVAGRQVGRRAGRQADGRQVSGCMSRLDQEA